MNRLSETLRGCLLGSTYLNQLRRPALKHEGAIYMGPQPVVDYARVELRLLAWSRTDGFDLSWITPPWMRKPGTMRVAFPDDVHTTTACDIFGVPADKVSSGMRQYAKLVNYRVAHGLTSRTPSKKAPLQ